MALRRAVAKAVAAPSDEAVNVQVILRCRPPSAEEVANRVPQVIQCDEDRREVSLQQTIAGKQFARSYHFDKVFPPDTTQEKLYSTAVAPIVDEVLEGFSCTIFAYGQTGTGKTHTMTGDLGASELTAASGVIPRAIQQIFDHLESTINEYTVKCSYLELYNEEITDLLATNNEASSKVRILEDRSGVVMHGLEETNVKTSGDIFSLLEQGSARRRTAETLLNKQSSRSHSVFVVTVSVREVLAEGEEVIRVGKLYLVDLAGSENITRSGAVEQRAKEAGNINKSLLTLGRVITALVEGQGHIPYRDSKLTRILRDSLGGKTKTCIIATIAPTVQCQEETTSTLDYAHRAKNIKNKPEVNEKISKTTHLKDMSSEITKLKMELLAQRQQNGVFLPADQYAEECEERRLALARVEELEEELQNVETRHEDEKAAMNGAFEAEKAVLQGELDATKQELAATVAALRSAEQTIREKNYLLEQHENSEKALAQHARSLTDQLQSAANDVAVLFTRVDAKNGIETDNLSLVQNLRSTAVESLSTMEATVAATAAAQAERFADTKRVLEEFVSRKEAEAARVQQQMMEMEAGIQALGAAATNATASLLNQGTTALSQIEQKQVEFMSVAKQAAEQANAAVADAYDALTNSMEAERQQLASFVKQQAESTDAVYNATQTIVNAVKEQLEEAKAQAAAAQQDVTMRLGAQSERVTAMEQEFVAAATTSKAELVQQMQALIDSFVDKQEQHVRQATGGIQQQLSEDQAAVGSHMSRLVAHAGASLDDLKENGDTVNTVYANAKQQLEQGGQEFDEAMNASAEQADAFLTETKAHADAAHQALRSHGKTVQASVKAATQSLTDVCEDQAAKCTTAAVVAVGVGHVVKENLESDRCADTAAATHVAGNASTGAENMDGFASDQRWKLAELSAGVRGALDDEYKTDKQRDQVPSRRSVPVPAKQLVDELCTRPAEQLLAVFRGQGASSSEFDHHQVHEEDVEVFDGHIDDEPAPVEQQEQEEEEEVMDDENQDPLPPSSKLADTEMETATGQKRMREVLAESPSPAQVATKSLKGAFVRAERRRGGLD